MKYIDKKSIKTILAAVFTLAILAVGALWYFHHGNVKGVEAGWWNDSWSYRKAIVINHSYVTGDLENFPVLISLTDASLGSHAQADGDDIIFIDDEGKKLSHEIETFATSTGVLVAWVKIPSLSSTDDTPLYMYYGNAGVGNQEDSTNVWNDDYQAVWHMNNTDMATSTDSTSHGNDAYGNGSPLAYPNGQIGGGLEFDDENDLYYQATGTSLEFNGDIIVSFWMNTSGLSETQHTGIVERSDWGVHTGWDFFDNGGELSFAVLGNGTFYEAKIDHDIVNDGEWHYINGIRLGTDVYLYIDGQNIAQDNSTNFDLCTTEYMTYGWVYGATSDTILLDELRISDTVPPEEWVETEFNNQNSPQTFLSVQAEEVGPGSVGYWSFDEGYGTTAHDESGQGNDGTITGAEWQDESMCVSGKCLMLDGSGDYVEVGDVDF